MTIAPPLDLHDYRERRDNIARARHKAVTERQEAALEASDAEHEYRKRKAVALARYRGEGMGAGEAEIMAEGDVAEHRKKRDDALALRRSAQERIAELERNASMLRSEFEASQRVG